MDGEFRIPSLPPATLVTTLRVKPSDEGEGNANKKTVSSNSSSVTSKESEIVPLENTAKNITKSEERIEKYRSILATLKYEPPEGGTSTGDFRYSLEILKAGSILGHVSFSLDKGVYLVGRVPGCDVVAEHITVSRLHAVLQFVHNEKTKSPEEEDVSSSPTLETGLYIYDLDSTHGTFLNKNRLFPRRYYKVCPGHMIKFGNSSRMYIVQGPHEHEEEESKETVTELLQQRLAKDLERKRMLEELGRRNPESGEGKESESEGIDWGMGEDAEEESDLTENPFAMDFDNKDLNLTDPKKTLRGWFEREGYDLIYDCREKAPGHFICRIDLPIDSAAERRIFAEVDLKGKKREAVVQCALKACQILDSYGVLRQSHAEGRQKRSRTKMYEEKDFYSSDEDTFLDRTGDLEKKREKRMKMAGKKPEASTETFESLNAKLTDMLDEEVELNLRLNRAARKKKLEDEEADSLEAFMTELSSTSSGDEKKWKRRLKDISLETERLRKLIDIVRPASLPQHLSGKMEKPPNPDVMSFDVNIEKPQNIHNPSATKTTNDDGVVTPKEKMHSESTDPIPKKVQTPMFGPRKVLTVKGPTLPPPDLTSSNKDGEDDDDDVYEKDDEDDVNDVSECNQVSLSRSPKSGDETMPDNHQSIQVPPEPSRNKRQRNRQRKIPKFVPDSGGNDYDNWVPPQGQSGDGRTSLNDKLGY